MFVVFCLFFTQGGPASCSRACFDAMLHPQSDDADSVGGLVHGNKVRELLDWRRTRIWIEEDTGSDRGLEYVCLPR